MFYHAIFDQTLVKLSLFAPDDHHAQIKAQRYYPKRQLVKLVRVKDGSEVTLTNNRPINAKVRTRV